MTRVLITDAHKRSALAVIRSLGRCGTYVIAASEKPRASGFYSRYCHERLVYTPPTNVSRFKAEMLQAVRGGDVDLLIPATDPTLAVISRHRDEFLPYVRIPIAQPEAVEIALSKARTLKLGQALDIPCPKTLFASTKCELEAAVRELGFPLVIKTDSILWLGSERLRTGQALKVHSESELDGLMDDTVGNGALLAVQEQISGPGCGYFALYEHGEPRASFQHRRLREYPFTGGSSSFRESVRLPELTVWGNRLLQALDWHGVAMVEFKVDERDGVPKLMELNPRFWGSLQLAIAAGVDFPRLLLQMTCGGLSECTSDYEEGVKCRFLLTGDIRHLLSVWRASAAQAPWHLKFKTTVDFVKDFADRDVHYDYISRDDLKPAFAHLLFGILERSRRS